MATAYKAEVKNRRLEVDWWVVSKRTIYGGLTLLVVLLVGAGAGFYVWRYGNPLKKLDPAVNVPAGARFLTFDGDVQVVRAETRDRVLARTDTQLYAGDIVQTQADGRARIQLADGSMLVVRPNSVVTIRDNASLDDGRRTQVRVAVERGQINVRTGEQTAGSRNIVETPLTNNHVGARTGVSFGVREDNTEEVRVNEGRIETATRGGEKTVVNGGEYVALNQSGAVKNRERLLDVPSPLSPRDLEKLLAGRQGTADVMLRWGRPASGGAVHYRVEVATSPFFVPTGKVAERDQLTATNYNVSELRTGVFFWRVRAVAASGQASDWCDPQKFTVGAAVAEGGGEGITVAGLTFEHVAGNVYIARGQTQPGNTVRISDRAAVAARDGTFQLQVSLPAGAREIAVEAEDPQGHVRRGRFPVTVGNQ